MSKVIVNWEDGLQKQFWMLRDFPENWQFQLSHSAWQTDSILILKARLVIMWQKCVHCTCMYLLLISFVSLKGPFSFCVDLLLLLLVSEQSPLWTSSLTDKLIDVNCQWCHLSLMPRKCFPGTLMKMLSFISEPFWKACVAAKQGLVFLITASENENEGKEKFVSASSIVFFRCVKHL